ncbi:restriction endonuclease subunit S [Xylanibacter rodentium]|uniref:restriction endonuclease subunit S n=2 Tax=Bacteria TaxID=2 RepID=UPI002578927B|nr:restriction endonuclease subunit S [Xylanibacter rodentium]
MENVSSSNGLEKRPKLRFPGFDEPWKENELSHYLVENTERNRGLAFGKEDVLSVSGEYGVINQIAFQGRSFAGESVADYHVVETDDIVYTKSPLKANPYGIIKVNKGIPGIVSTLYAVYHPLNTVAPRFVDLYFANDLRLNKFLKPLVNIGAKHDMKVNNSFVLTGTVVFPSIGEQQKLVDFFAKLDRRIEAQRKIVDTLKKYKRGLLTYAFEEMTLSDDADSTTYLFSEIAQRRKEKYNPDCNVEYPCIELEHIEQGTGRLLGSVSSKTQSSIKTVAKNGDVLFGKLRPYLRKFAFAEQDIVCSSEIWAFVPSKYVIPKYLYYLVQTEHFLRVANISSGTKMPRAEWANIEKEPFDIPYIPNQEKVVSILEAVDKKISVSGDSLRMLLNFRDGLLQQLFI